MPEIIYNFEDIAKRVKNPNYDPSCEPQQQCEPMPCTAPAPSVFQCVVCGGMTGQSAHPPICDGCFRKAAGQAGQGKPDPVPLPDPPFLSKRPSFLRKRP